MNIFSQSPKHETKYIVSGDPVWIFGSGSFGQAVARACTLQGIDVQGFVQTKPTASLINGLPVRAWSQLSSADRAMALLIGIFNRDTPLDGLVHLAHQAGCQNIVMPWNLYAQFGEELGWRYWLTDPNFLLSHELDLIRCHDRLADTQSQECLKRLVNFRLGLDLEYAKFQHEELQYFNSITLPPLNNRPIHYIDGGAYNGDTFHALIKTFPVQQAWLFEPDPANFSELTQTIRKQAYPSYCLPLALSNNYCLLRFSSGLGEAGHIDNNGDEGITAVAIDDLLAGQQVDFIKLDIEGAEKLALTGAERTIAKHRPVLAVSCYHHASDLWELPDLLSELAPNYKYYLRQHAFNSFDLVLYGIPDALS